MSQTPGLTGAQAVRILQTYSADGGAAGADPNYGHGTLDLGWALARNDPTRLDTAVSGHHYNSETASLEVVVQNRGALPAPQLTLRVELNGQISAHALPTIAPGGSATVPLPIDATTAAGPITLREAYATFNMGVGFAAYVAPGDAAATVAAAQAAGYDAWVAGTVKKDGDRKAVTIPSLGLEFSGDTLQVR
jgi:hypothetical protein